MLIIPTLLDLSLKMFDGIRQYAQSRKTVQKQQLDSVSDLFNQIADTLSATCESLWRGEYPSGHCGEMAHYAQCLPHTLTGILEADLADYYARTMMQAHELEQLCAYLSVSDDQERKRQLSQLNMAAGTFRAAAALIKVG